MIATVTLNPAIDKSVIVRDFEVGKTNRGEVARLDAGGKGINVAKALKRLGSTVCALGFAAGSNGRFILDALRVEGIPADFVTVPGETRVNLKIHDPEKGTETELNEPGFRDHGRARGGVAAEDRRVCSAMRGHGFFRKPAAGRAAADFCGID